MNRPNPIGHFTFYRFCVFLANWRMHWRRAPSASRWMNWRIISISSTSSRSWISWRVSVIPWLWLCMTWISQRCIVIDWSRYRVGRWAEEAPDTGFYQKALWCGLWDPLWGGWKDEYRLYPAALEEMILCCNIAKSHVKCMMHLRWLFCLVGIAIDEYLWVIHIEPFWNALGV